MRMTVNAYLARIGYWETPDPTFETLRQLHQAHLLAVPFENLDIHLDHPIILSVSAFYDKIIRRGRGGFCYELNGLFGWLLEQLGFKVTVLSARVFDGAEPGPDFDHMLLLVELEEHVIADVGFGDSFREPLLLDRDDPITQRGDAYRLIETGSQRVLQRRRDTEWESQYAFSLIPRQLADFNEMCHYQQTSPASHFTQKTVCSLATRNGRVTLSNSRLIVTENGDRMEGEVRSDDEYRAVLQTRFGIWLGEEEPVDRLMG